jgi:AGZA family xanthine/uracil permease-like MFS transporter
MLDLLCSTVIIILVSLFGLFSVPAPLFDLLAGSSAGFFIAMKHIRWAGWGDVNAFFGLMLDNVAVLLLLVTSITTGTDAFTPDFVLQRMIPGTAIGVLIGDLVYTVMGVRLAARHGRSDVTAMPLGLDTPSTFAVAFLVLLPTLKDELGHHPGEREAAMAFAWHVGAAVLVIIGILKTLLAPVGNAVRRWVPRAGLLGSLAAIALALIAFMPLVNNIAALPVVGMVSLTVILVTLVAHRPLPGHVPGALAAVVIGTGVYFILRAFGQTPPSEISALGTGTVTPLPSDVWEPAWWTRVFGVALEKLPVMLPFALATIVGGIDCTESAAAAGDEFDTRAVLLTEGLASVAAGLCGGVIQNTPYIGHPAYKAMGGRCAYTLATGLFIGAAGYFGWFMHVFEWLPPAAIFPILVYVGVEITGVSFRVTPERHYPAIAFATLPALAALALIPLQGALAGRAPAPAAAGMVQTLLCLSNGFIITSLLWGATLAALIDGKMTQAAIYLLVAATFSLFGVIHSPLAEAPLALPPLTAEDMELLPRFQTPWHWAGAYGLAAGLLFVLGLGPGGKVSQPCDRGEVLS